jgi:hypothetical protein
MERKPEIIIHNKLVRERRDIHVYHHSPQSVHIVSSNSNLELIINKPEEKSILEISMVSEPGGLKNECFLDLPHFMNFRFWSSGEIFFIRNGKRTLLKIPAGPPTWKIKITIPSDAYLSSSLLKKDNIFIGDADDRQDLLL